MAKMIIRYASLPAGRDLLIRNMARAAVLGGAVFALVAVAALSIR